MKEYFLVTAEQHLVTFWKGPVGNLLTERVFTRIHYRQKMFLAIPSDWQKNTILNAIFKHGPFFKDIYPFTCIAITSIKWTKKFIWMNRIVWMTLLTVHISLRFSVLWNIITFSFFDQTAPCRAEDIPALRDNSMFKKWFYFTLRWFSTAYS